MNKKLFTSESVTSGHPDKICDQISDAVLDEYIKRDPYSRVACEVAITTGIVVVMGEITSKADNVDIDSTVRGVIRDIGYTKEMGFDPDMCAVSIMINKQSPDISMGVDENEKGEIGAGDQGMMFGYAIDNKTDYMPLPISLANRLTRRLTEVRQTGVIPYLRPDGKAQVSVEYDDNGNPIRVESVVVSTQHSDGVENELIYKDIKKNVIDFIIPSELIDKDTKFFVNPTGRFVVGGPVGDTGLTGRKIIVDTYGGWTRHGGGAFSGKDPTKVDRSAAYMARLIAKNIVASGMAKECEIQLAYAIGVANPVSVWVNTFKTGVLSDDKISDIVKKEFDLTPAGIIDTLNLRRPIYRPSAASGHFGRVDIDFPWESLSKTDLFKKYL